MGTLLLDGSESVEELAHRMTISPSRAVRAAFEEMGRMWTIQTHPERSEIVDLVGLFGFTVRWIDESRP